MKIQTLLTTLLFAIQLNSCITPESEQASTEESLYYDIQEMLNPEIARLQSEKPMVRKVTMMNGETKTEEIKVEDWKKELAVFLNANINKPILKGSYEIEKKEGLITYTALKEDLPIKEMKVKYVGEPTTKIEAVEEKETVLFHNKRELGVTITDGKIASYSLVGYQKMPAKDSLVYKIEATILY
ncbi:hypothetical protein R9C00_27160 [Flammeovirgaceae bacterium SG7u.111]|nr:hypothetical protein [Flammeovirgaceae bacterium SG7u.132]WPO35381.1 hypothetical protein R9C00_27160 [Flammeovirgaceae bacterium SG7u.111]